MSKTTVSLDPDTVLAIRQMAATQGRSQAELIRNALHAYTRKGERLLPSGLGKYDSGETAVSKRAREILRSAAHSPMALIA